MSVCPSATLIEKDGNKIKELLWSCDLQRFAFRIALSPHDGIKYPV